MTRITRLATVALALAFIAPVTAQAQHAYEGKEKMKDIVTVAIEAGNFQTLATALKAAGLVETLKGEGPFTVFAPNDDAFAKLPKGTVDALLADKEQLTAVLTYHVLPGKVMAADVLKAAPLMPATVNGQQLNIRVKDGSVYVNGAKVIATDIVGSNGVIHVIDGVLLPKTEAATSGR